VAQEVRWEVWTCECDVHPLLPLLLVLFFVAHLHHLTHAVPNNNNKFPLVSLAGIVHELLQHVPADMHICDLY